MSEFENQLQQNQIKKQKIKIKMPHANKTSSGKGKFGSNTDFLLNLNIRVKSHAAKLLAPLPVSAWPKSLLPFEFKNIKCVNRS